jgi:hypothetical protein
MLNIDVQQPVREEKIFIPAVLSSSYAWPLGPDKDTDSETRTHTTRENHHISYIAMEGRKDGRIDWNGRAGFGELANDGD